MTPRRPQPHPLSHLRAAKSPEEPAIAPEAPVVLPEARAGSGRQRRVTGWRQPGSTPWEVPGKSHADRVIAFIERHELIPSGKDTGKPVRLRPWQKRLIRKVYGPDSRPNRAAIVSLARGNGKSALAAFIAVAELYLTPSSEVLCVATTERQARIVYFRAARIIETSAVLRDHALVYANRSDPYTILPGRNGYMAPMPADERSLQGWQPSFCIVDEVGFVELGTWTAMQSASGKHPRSLVLGIGTPGYDKGLMYGMRTAAASEDPPPFFAYVEHAANPSAGVKDRREWKRANPALGDFLQPDALALDAATLPPNVFRTFRLGLWADREEQWMSSDVWDALPVVAGWPAAGTPVALGFDGSVAIDATGIVGKDVSTGRYFVVAKWERPKGDRRWRVPRDQVLHALQDAFARWKVLALFADPWHFRDMLEELAAEYGPERVVSFPTNVRMKMAAATDRFLSTIYSGSASWDGDEALRRHILAAVAEVTPAGEVIRKRADKPQAIDLAVAAILAEEASATAEPEPARPVIY
jgi:phage terminase large subunit-like protein